MKILISLFVTFSCYANATEYVSGDGTFIDGYDPVAYHTLNKAVQGSKEFSHKYDGITILFSTQKHKDLFITSPSKYMPAYKGWCAYAMAHGGKLVDIDPKSFKIIDGNLYLFYDSFWADTLKKWNKDSDQNQIETAEKNWLNHK